MALIPAAETHSAVADLLRGRDTSSGPRPAGSPERQTQDDGRRRYEFSRPLDEILSERRSVREFADAQVTQAELRWIAESALACERRVWHPGQHGSTPLFLLATVFRVTGLAPGLYDCPGFEARAASGAELEGLRERYADAAALLHVCGRITTEYPQCVTRAGSLGYAAWLAAIDGGLAGSVYGGGCALVTAAARRSVPGSRHLFTVAVGFGA
jgi:hypothetical protein